MNKKADFDLENFMKIMDISDKQKAISFMDRAQGDINKACNLYIEDPFCNEKPEICVKTEENGLFF